MIQPELLNPPQKSNPPKWTIRIWFDGGCSPNPGNKYGSYEVEAYEELVLSKVRFGLGHGTNNEAEFEALEAALMATIAYLSVIHTPTPENRVVIFTDSMILRNRLMGKNRIFKKAKHAESSGRMYRKAARILELLAVFHSFEVIWRNRETNVARFGH